MSLKDKLKSKQVRSDVVLVDGDEYLIKGIGRVAKNELVAKSQVGKSIDNAKLEANLLAACVCDPTTGEPIMPNAADWDIPSHIAGPLMEVALKVCGFGNDEVADYRKKSETQTS